MQLELPNDKGNEYYGKTLWIVLHLVLHGPSLNPIDFSTTSKVLAIFWDQLVEGFAF